MLPIHSVGWLGLRLWKSEVPNRSDSRCCGSGAIGLKTFCSEHLLPVQESPHILAVLHNPGRKPCMNHIQYDSDITLERKDGCGFKPQ